MSYHTYEDVRRKLIALADKYDTDAEAARKLGMNNASLSRVLNSKTSVIPDKALKALGLVPVTVYTEAPKKGARKPAPTPTKRPSKSAIKKSVVNKTVKVKRKPSTTLKQINSANTSARAKKAPAGMAERVIETVSHDTLERAAERGANQIDVFGNN